MQRPLHGLHAALLAGTVPFFLGALLNDITYSRTYEIQWKNFSSWLLVGGLVVGGLVWVWALIDTWRRRPRSPLQLLYGFLVTLMWVLGFINALLHSADAAASMSTALLLSWVIALLAIAATWLGFGGLRRRVAS